MFIMKTIALNVSPKEWQLTGKPPARLILLHPLLLPSRLTKKKKSYKYMLDLRHAFVRLSNGNLKMVYQEKEAELRRMQQMLAQMQAQMQQQQPQ